VLDKIGGLFAPKRGEKATLPLAPSPSPASTSPSTPAMLEMARSLVDRAARTRSLPKQERLLNFAQVRYSTANPPLVPRCVLTQPPGLGRSRDQLQRSSDLRDEGPTHGGEGRNVVPQGRGGRRDDSEARSVNV
jgi:hypothetical protein